jgi:hypothetical protein
MRITVLVVPGCPNASMVRERIVAALGRQSAEVELVEVADTAAAARWGMTGSPTVLLDGVDPFAVPGAAPDLSCRLYGGAGGQAEGAPSVAELRRVLQTSGP